MAYYDSQPSRPPAGFRRSMLCGLGLALSAVLSGLPLGAHEHDRRLRGLRFGCGDDDPVPCGLRLGLLQRGPPRDGNAARPPRHQGGPRVGPPGSPTSTSTLILVKGVPYVIDCGYGTSSQLVGAGYP